MIGRVNTGGGGKGAALTVTAPAGATVTASKDGKTLTRVAGDDGVVVFRGLETGTWTLSITDGTQTASKAVEIVTDYSTEISYNLIPEFTYTGDYDVVNDTDEPITTSQDNWKIRLLTSGTLTFTNLNGAEDGIDVFLVGGGGSGAKADSVCTGAGGGYTETSKNVRVTKGTSYSIVVGAGGLAPSSGSGNDGGASSAFGFTAAGGKKGLYYGVGVVTPGGDGGSGGGALNASGGSDGGNGGNHASYGKGGKGQGTTTREFGESGARLYAGGGGGRAESGSEPKGGAGGGGVGLYNTYKEEANGTPNTGGGGGAAGKCSSGAGGSGIVVIRNKR